MFSNASNGLIFSVVLFSMGIASSAVSCGGGGGDNHSVGANERVAWVVPGIVTLMPAPPYRTDEQTGLQYITTWESKFR